MKKRRKLGGCECEMDETLNRLYRLVYLLKKNPDGLRLEEISAEVGASMARLRTDLEILTHELPVTNQIDEESGEEYWSLISTAGSVPAPAFTPPEVLAFLWAIDRQDSEGLNCVRAKLFQALLGKGEQSQLTNCQTRLLIKGWRGLYDSPETERIVGRMEEALLAERRLLLDYVDAVGESFQFEMEPYGLVYYWVWGFWYLVGLIKQELTVLRLDRIKDYMETGHFSYPSGFSLEEVFADAWGVELTAPLVTVQIKFYDEYNVRQRVLRDTAHRRKASITKGEGYFTYSDRVRGVNEIKPWVRSFGSSAVVLAPEELKADMVRSARWVLGLYR